MIGKPLVGFQKREMRVDQEHESDAHGFIKSYIRYYSVHSTFGCYATLVVAHL